MRRKRDWQRFGGLAEEDNALSINSINLQKLYFKKQRANESTRAISSARLIYSSRGLLCKSLYLVHQHQHCFESIIVASYSEYLNAIEQIPIRSAMNWCHILAKTTILVNCSLK